MTEHETVRQMTEKQRNDLIATMVGAMPALTFDEAQAIIGAKGPFVVDIRGVFQKRKRAASEPKTVLLQSLGTVVIPAIAAPFVARNAFVIGGQANIAWMGQSFKEWFLGKTEEPIAEATLCYARLSKASLDLPILDEIGDDKETTLGQIFYLMSRQANDTEGSLLVDGWANVFYVIDAYGTLRAVDVRRGRGGWGVFADPVGGPNGWGTKDRFFSRNSSSASVAV